MGSGEGNTATVGKMGEILRQEKCNEIADKIEEAMGREARGSNLATGIGAMSLDEKARCSRCGNVVSLRYGKFSNGINLDRKYYKCHKCGFFLWAEDEKTYKSRMHGKKT